MHFHNFPVSSAFQCWKTSFKIEVCSCSGDLTDAVLWIKEVERLKPFPLELSVSVGTGLAVWFVVLCVLQSRPCDCLSPCDGVVWPHSFSKDFR